jgi:RNA polymerase sigma factor (sigma-70 family)
VHCDEQGRTLERFVAKRGDRLLRTAALLAGSRADGEDLLQSALERLLRHWRRIDGDPENYVRRTLYNLAADGWRRQRVRHRHAARFGPGPPVDPATAVDLRDAVVRVLVRLPPRQRAVLVLRYFKQLSEAERRKLWAVR